VNIVDANILLYAVDEDSPRHESARQWWDGQLYQNEPICLCWPVLTAFIRISTNARIYLQPLTTDQAVMQVQSWLTRPCVRILSPTERHWEVFSLLLRNANAAGNLVMDAHIAALAIEHGCRICSTDNDFAQWPEVRWMNPIT
jgi:toxin-antitoxin system PIN domain toxin